MNAFKRQMKEKINQYSNEKYLDGYIKSEYLTDDGDADIYLKINRKSELFNEWTVGNQLELDDKVYKFLEDKTSMLENDTQINLHIIGTSIDQKDQELIKHTFKEHYAIELYKIQKEYKTHKIKIITLFLFGLLSLLSYLWLYLFTEFDFFMEVFCFIFSFALWEAFDLIIYDFSDVKYEREAITQNLLTEIDFEDKKLDT